MSPAGEARTDARAAARRPLLIAVCAAACAAPAAVIATERAPTLGDLNRTGDLICELQPSVPAAQTPPPDSQRNARPPGRARSASPDMLLVFDRIGEQPGAARLVSSKRAGAHTVKIYPGETGLHLVEDLSGSVIVTTLLGCERSTRDGARCLRYPAVNAWHFDRSVHLDPDAAFRRLPGTSYRGYCEAWHMGEGVTARK